MNTLIEKFSEKIIQLRILLIGMCLLMTVFFLYVLQDIRIRANLSDFAPQGHPYMKVQQKLMEVFGGLHQVSIAVVVRDGDIFNYNTLNKVAEITHQLYLLQGVNPGRVVSLSARKIKDVTASSAGFKVQRLMRDAPRSRNDLDALKNAIIRNPMIYGPVVSKDFKATLITADFWPETDSKTIFYELNRLVEPYRDAQHDILVTGRPILEGWIYQYLPHMGTVFIGTLVIMAFFLYSVFRSRRGVILPLSSALMATIWGLGMMVVNGYYLSPTTILVPFLIAALEICHSIQFIKRYYEEMNKNGNDSRRAAQKSLKALFIPAIISVITDGIGFLSLFIVPLNIIKSMAVGGGMGVFSIFFTTVIFIPTVLSLLPPPKKFEVEQEEKATVINTLLSMIPSLSQRGSLRWTIIFFCIIGCCGVLGASILVVGDNEEGSATLYADSPYNNAERNINRLFTGSSNYFVFVEGNQEEALINADVLKEMEALQRYLVSDNNQAGYSLSLADYIKGLNMVMLDGKPQEFRIPDNNGTIAEYLFLYAISGFPGDFDPVVSPNYQYANIKVDVKDHKAETINSLILKTKEWIKLNNKNTAVRYLYGGGEIGTQGAVNEVVKKALIESIILVLVLTFVCVICAYRSLIAGCYLILPLVFGVLVTFGIMGLAGIILTIETLPVAALGIGVGVDYGLYVVSRIREECAAGGNNSLDKAILRALMTSGKAVFFTGSTVVIGVLAWIFSEIRLQARFGLLLGLLIVLNILGALVLLPVLIRMGKPRFITEGMAGRGQE